MRAAVEIGQPTASQARLVHTIILHEWLHPEDESDSFLWCLGPSWCPKQAPASHQRYHEGRQVAVGDPPAASPSAGTINHCYCRDEIEAMYGNDNGIYGLLGINKWNQFYQYMDSSLGVNRLMGTV